MSTAKTCEAIMQADIEEMCRALRPETIGCFELPDVSVLPVRALVSSGATTWLVDSHVGRIEELLADHIARVDEGRPCLACEPTIAGQDVCASYLPATSDPNLHCQTLLALPRDPARCHHFVPGQRLRVILGDARRGRGAAFTTRVETIVAAASTPAAAVESARLASERTKEVDVPLPIEEGSFDLVISVLAPSQLMERPYCYFDSLMRRRFGTWTGSTQPAAVEDLRIALFRRQLDSYVAELARVTRPVRGRLYFATMPVEPSDDGWLLERGIAECLEALAAWFAFDFESFAPELFLRRCNGHGGVLQSALLRRKQTIGGSP